MFRNESWGGRVSSFSYFTRKWNYSGLFFSLSVSEVCFNIFTSLCTLKSFSLKKQKKVQGWNIPHVLKEIDLCLSTEVIVQNRLEWHSKIQSEPKPIFFSGNSFFCTGSLFTLHKKGFLQKLSLSLRFLFPVQTCWKILTDETCAQKVHNKKQK